MNIGYTIKLCRKTKGYTQSELARRSELSVSYISLLEKSKRDPNISVIESISKALDLPISILILLASENTELPELGEVLTDKLKKLALEVLNNVK